MIACDDVMDNLRQTTVHPCDGNLLGEKKIQKYTGSCTGTNREKPVEVVWAHYKDSPLSALARGV